MERLIKIKKANMNLLPKNRYILKCFVVIVLMSPMFLGCESLSHKQKKIDELQHCTGVGIYLLKSKLNIFKNGFSSPEGYKKLYLDLVIQNSLNDTLVISLWNKQDGKIKGFFSIAYDDEQLKQKDTLDLDISYNNDYFKINPYSSDTLSFFCSLGTFDNKEALFKAHQLSSGGNLIYESPFPRNFFVNGNRMLNSTQIGKGNDYKLEIIYH